MARIPHPITSHARIHVARELLLNVHCASRYSLYRCFDSQYRGSMKHHPAHSAITRLENAKLPWNDDHHVDDNRPRGAALTSETIDCLYLPGHVRSKPAFEFVRGVNDDWHNIDYESVANQLLERMPRRASLQKVKVYFENDCWSREYFEVGVDIWNELLERTEQRIGTPDGELGPKFLHSLLSSVEFKSSIAARILLADVYCHLQASPQPFSGKLQPPEVQEWLLAGVRDISAWSPTSTHSNGSFNSPDPQASSIRLYVGWRPEATVLEYIHTQQKMVFGGWKERASEHPNTQIFGYQIW